MKFIAALLLAIPTYGLSVLALFAHMLYKAKNVKPNMENAIKFLSKSENIIGTCFKEISYPQALGYASEMGSITKKIGDFVEFETEIDENQYIVTLNREPNGRGAILNAKKIDWVKNVYSWLVQHMGYQNLPECSKIPSLKWIQLGSAINPEFYKRDIREIPVDLCRIKTLERLYLQRNQITELPEEIGNLENLKDLKLGGNNLIKLPKTIGCLQNLEILTVWMNELVEIPPEIGLLSNLKGLSFWGNPLAKLPEEITNLTQLKILELGDMPNLILSPGQRIWIKNLTENGCDVWLD